MTSKGAFTDEEWERVRRAPLVAGMAITIADPGASRTIGPSTAAASPKRSS